MMRQFTKTRYFFRMNITMDVIYPTTFFVLAACIFSVALLYSSVGHGGASGYIAVMALFSVAPVILKPTALILNIIVSAVATICFARSGHFTWRLFWPFALTSVPASFFGGCINLPPYFYRPLVGIILLLSAYYLFFRKQQHQSDIAMRQPELVMALFIGCFLGFLSGLTGVGGGIFLSPLLLMMNWGKAREVAAVSALFIMVNSAAGLAGHISSIQSLPPFVPYLAMAAVLGGVAGSLLGSRHLPTTIIVKALSAVLTIAGLKLILI